MKETIAKLEDYIYVKDISIFLFAGKSTPEILAIFYFLSLSLFMFWIFTYNSNNSISPYNFTLYTNFLN